MRVTSSERDVTCPECQGLVLARLLRDRLRELGVGPLAIASA